MAYLDPLTKYPFPPLPEGYKPFPSEIPWDTPIAELCGWWLTINCECGWRSDQPFRRMAADMGWKRTLRTIVPKLKCRQCGGRPNRVELVDSPTGDTGRHGARMTRLVIIGGLAGTLDEQISE